MKKVLLMVLMIFLAISSVSFTMAGRAVADEAEEISVELAVSEPKQDVQIEVQPIRKSKVLTERIAVPEVEIVQTEHEIATKKLEEIKANLHVYYTDEEIRLTTLIVQAEDLVAHSDTIWSAHVWVILGRVGAPGFGANSIIEVLSAPSQFSTWCAKCLSAEPVPEVEEIVRDVFARKILEDLGFSEREVGRTVPATHLFFDNRDGDFYNEFYRYCWGDQYDPFLAPYNPYDC